MQIVKLIHQFVLNDKCMYLCQQILDYFLESLVNTNVIITAFKQIYYWNLYNA